MIVGSVYLYLHKEILSISYDKIAEFFTAVELKTFDARQQIYASHKNVDKNIVIIDIDEKTYTVFTEKYGEWPMPRDIYADVIEYIQKDKPLAIGLDLLFINPDKYKPENDKKLVQALEKYDNVYTAINFDNEKTRVPADLPDRLKIKLENKSRYNFDKNFLMAFTNCRLLMPEIMDSNANIGEINSFFADDNTLREFYPFAKYKNSYYPNLSTKIAIRMIEQQTGQKVDKLAIDKDNHLLIGDKKIPLQQDFGVMLNWLDWYDKNNNFERISFVDVYKMTKGDLEPLEKDYFKDKIIYFGATATALYDTKNSPINNNVPGVVLHTTFINNLLNDNFIHKTSLLADIAICIFLALLLVVALFKIKRQFVDIIILFAMTGFYLIFAGWVMEMFSLWIPVFIPIIVVVATFITIYIVKYFITSRDLEYTYKLATTDGLTELYNHRFFQEQLLLNIENSKRYNTQFSLILLDIDYFKKFNDTYGHQAGDAVLRQVAMMLKKLVRSTDIVCRYGGEEMSIILSNTAYPDAIITAQKICETIAQTPFNLGASTTKNVTISLGVATYPEHGKTPNELIEHADKGLYAAKANGRNQVGLQN